MVRKSHPDDVRELYTKFGIIVSDKPTHLVTKKLQERVDCMQEELAEFIEACGFQDMAGMADSLVDLATFAIGTAVMMGLPWQELWDDVHRANMSKERGVGKRGHKVDLIKPPGWEGPKTMEILQRAGYTYEDSLQENHRDDV